MRGSHVTRYDAGMSDAPPAHDRETDLQHLAAFIDANEWTFAKTMPNLPHWYVVRGKHEGDFDRAVETIRRWGTERAFGRRRFTYLAVDEHEYWTMGAPIHETTIINRARVKR